MSHQSIPKIFSHSLFPGHYFDSGDEPHILKMTWSHPEETLTLEADLQAHDFRVYRENDAGRKDLIAPAA
mgnify:CR=1 FL=1